MVYEPDAADAVRALGEHTFKGRLYSPEKAKEVMNVNILTGEETHDIPPAPAVETLIEGKNAEDAARAAEKSYRTYTEKVALVAGSNEQLAEGGSLVSRAAWFHFDVTGGMDNHEALQAADAHEDFDVEWEADYEKGELHVTVEYVGDGPLPDANDKPPVEGNADREFTGTPL